MQGEDLASLKQGAVLKKGVWIAYPSHDWFLAMLRNCEEFEVETDVPGEWPVPFWSETVRGVMVE